MNFNPKDAPPGFVALERGKQIDDGGCFGED